MIKTFGEAVNPDFIGVKFLESYIPTPEKKHPGELGLKRMRRLVELLGNPQFSYPTIHVGGTSGKGSTATIIATILAENYKVGLHTSPHLVKITERIKIGSKDIPDNDFIGLLNEVYPAIKRVEESELGRPSYFEIVTCMAFLHFRKKKVDIAVIEVGMGGRYDATNIIRPEVAVITNVGLDHTEILGDTVEKIAHDKAGIIKSGIKVVSGSKQNSVVRIIKLKCREEKSSLSLLQIPSPGRSSFGHLPGVISAFGYKIKKITPDGSMFDYFGDKTYRNLIIPLLGRHQVENAAIAIRAIEVLREKEEDIRKGLSNAFIPGRLEIFRRKPLVILDGAHNVEKMKALVTAIRQIFPKKKIRAVIAIKSGKDAGGILKEILPICHKVIFTKFRLTTDLGDTFSYEPSELLKMLKQVQHDTTVINNPIIAVKEAMNNADSDDLILVTGSLYLVGEVKRKIRNSKHEILNKFK